MKHYEREIYQNYEFLCILVGWNLYKWSVFRVLLTELLK